MARGSSRERGRLGEDKAAALRALHALNPHPEAVADAAFVGGGDFFDPRDVVQVKYEMLRRVRAEGQAVTQAAAAFGFSRPAFYQARQSFKAEGLPGLLRQRPGPRRAHKLTEVVVAFLQQTLAQEPGLGARELARRLQAGLEVSVHPRTIERGMAQRQKRGHRS
ncbi:MAG: helix-turn-helix domain-containing protein [Chloroflexi bacterium]|nr:helix-turn-helix domain-containing protein [Chloroflexota bacterium]